MVRKIIFKSAKSITMVWLGYNRRVGYVGEWEGLDVVSKRQTWIFLCGENLEKLEMMEEIEFVGDKIKIS